MKSYWLLIGLLGAIALGWTLAADFENEHTASASPPAPAGPRVTAVAEKQAPQPAFVEGVIINAPPAPEIENLDTLHAKFVREARADSWAQRHEAELGDAVGARTRRGDFNQEGIECRTTLCEMRLSARGVPQTAALRQWYDAVDEQPPSDTLQMKMAWFAGQRERADVTLVFEEPGAGPASAD